MALGLHFDGKLTPLEVDQIELQGRRAVHWWVGCEDSCGSAGQWSVGRTLVGCEDTGGRAVVRSRVKSCNVMDMLTGSPPLPSPTGTEDWFMQASSSSQVTLFDLLFTGWSCHRRQVAGLLPWHPVLLS